MKRPATGPAGETESRAALEAEVVLLREENARLKAARHQQHDVGKLLERTRSLRSQELDRGATSPTRPRRCSSRGS